MVDYEGHDGGCAIWTPDGPRRQAGENYYDSHRSIVDDWLDAVRDGTEPRVPGREGLKDLEVVMAAAASLDAQGAVIPVGEQ
ncbi:hypothetical protein ACIBQ1_47770 [Nonomuraea sp. NPDC050153]|uniref:hypothetical protein n=1 Tax=Nonomuraea sp. NPDC050153 TaxID=3364359 RepID=UPI0037B8143A